MGFAEVEEILVTKDDEDPKSEYFPVRLIEAANGSTEGKKTEDTGGAKQGKMNALRKALAAVIEDSAETADYTKLQHKLGLEALRGDAKLSVKSLAAARQRVSVQTPGSASARGSGAGGFGNGMEDVPNSTNKSGAKTSGSIRPALGGGQSSDAEESGSDDEGVAVAQRERRKCGRASQRQLRKRKPTKIVGKSSFALTIVTALFKKMRSVAPTVLAGGKAGVTQLMRERKACEARAAIRIAFLCSEMLAAVPEDAHRMAILGLGASMALPATIIRSVQLGAEELWGVGKAPKNAIGRTTNRAGRGPPGWF